MFSALNTGPPGATALGKTLRYVPNIMYPTQPDRVTVGKEKYDSLLGK
jgi:hypothetical protein